jgi:hypothetical protein
MTDLFGGTLPITLDAQVKEIEREIALRRRVYPRWTEAKKLSQATADRQIAVMEAVAATLRRVGNR